MDTGARLYFHSPCFDGIASAVIARSFLVRGRRWPDPELVVVNYDARDQWYATPFPHRAAVVDFLFHPEAAFWADHHATTFLGPSAASAFRSEDETKLYDPSAASCAGLLQSWLGKRGEAESQFDALARWADKIDSADYESVDEALFPAAPALRIAASLATANSADCVSIVRILGTNSLEQAARVPEVSARASRVDDLVAAGLRRVEKALSMGESGIAEFEVDSRGVIINRYSAYCFAPTARYSAALILGEDGDRISVMRNPWMRFESIHLGKLCSAFGGGGHQRVGAVQFPSGSTSRAREVFARIVRRIAAEDRRAGVAKAG